MTGRRQELVRLELELVELRRAGASSSPAPPTAHVERELERLRRLERWQRVEGRR